MPIAAAYTKELGVALFRLALVAAVGPLLIWYININRIVPDVVLVGIVTLFCGLAVLQLLATAAFRRPLVGGLVLGLAAIALLYDGLVGIRTLPAGVALWSAFFAGLIAACVLSGKAAAAIGRFLTIFLVVLCGILLGSIATSEVWGERGRIQGALLANYPPLDPPAVVPPTTPDIYYIIFDRYARADVLAEVYAYDNTEFLEQLRNRGFAVAENAYSAYQRTAHSLASTLNLGYIDAAETGKGSRDWVPLYDVLSAPRLYPFLKNLGYRIETLGSWWEPTRGSRLADANDAYFAVPESLRPFAEGSLLSLLIRATGIPFFDPRQRHCQRVHHKFEVLAGGASTGTPRFVFAHFLVPHPPFVLDSKGRCTSVKEAASNTRAENYISQLRFANERTLEMIDAIMARDPTAIIVLQSDEGPWPARYAGEEIEYFGADISNVVWRDVPPDELREKMAILSAIRLPGADPAVLEGDFAPVNTFRVVLRETFGMDLPDLDRNAFVFHSDAALYDLSSVLPSLSGARR